jgi:curved DNA-binding protein CbpA
MVMAAAEQDGTPDPDLYQLLGVPRGASDGEITRAWRRRAAAEHPDRRPRDAAAPARFRAVTEAYQVLGDPARRAAYDRSLREQPRRGADAAEGPVPGPPARSQRGSDLPVTVRQRRVPEPPLRVGPVWIEVPATTPLVGSRTADDDAVRLAALAELAAWYLADDGGWPW